MQNLEEMAAIERREYQRKWRSENPDRVRKHTADYWRRKAAKKLAKQEVNDGNSKEVCASNTIL
ncbi:MAG: phosphatase [Oscillospiraceae bacterium]|nr:phosphatase [Oscillospiraceae bacterium]